MSTQPEALRLADDLDSTCPSQNTYWLASAELRAQHEQLKNLKSVLGGVLKCERNSDGQIVLNGWQESVIRKQLEAAEAHK